MEVMYDHPPILALNSPTTLHETHPKFAQDRWYRSPPETVNRKKNLLTRTAEVRNGPDAADDISGLRIAVGVLMIPVLLAFLSWFGLWKDKLWGWWLALLDNLAITGVLAYSALDDGWKNIDGEAAALAAMFAVLVLFLLLPPVKRFYWEIGSSVLSVPGRAIGAERQ